MVALAFLCHLAFRWHRLISLGVEQEHQSLVYLMKFSFFSAEIEAHIEPLLDCIFKGGC